MKNFGTYLQGVKSEMARVEWPKPEEFIGATIVTLVLVAFFAVYFWFLDTVLQWAIYKVLFGYVRG